MVRAGNLDFFFTEVGFVQILILLCFAYTNWQILILLCFAYTNWQILILLCFAYTNWQILILLCFAYTNWQILILLCFAYTNWQILILLCFAYTNWQIMILLCFAYTNWQMFVFSAVLCISCISCRKVWERLRKRERVKGHFQTQLCVYLHACLLLADCVRVLLAVFRISWLPAELGKKVYWPKVCAAGENTSFFVYSYTCVFCVFLDWNKKSWVSVNVQCCLAVKRFLRSVWEPWREARNVWCLPSVWNLRAVI